MDEEWIYGGEPQQINAAAVTWNMFDLLGVSPMIGRDFNPVDAAYSRSDVEVYRERLPHAKIVALPGDGYHVAASYPDACVSAVKDFIADTRRG